MRRYVDLYKDRNRFWAVADLAIRKSAVENYQHAGLKEDIEGVSLLSDSDEDSDSESLQVPGAEKYIYDCHKADKTPQTFFLRANQSELHLNHFGLGALSSIITYIV